MVALTTNDLTQQRGYVHRNGPPRPPQELWRSGRSKRHAPCAHCGEIDSQCITLSADWRHASPAILDTWCVRGSAEDGGWQDATFGFRTDRGGVWYYQIAADGARILSRRAQAPQAPLADALTIDAVLRDVARLYGLSEQHRAALYARGYDPRLVGPTARYPFATLPANAADRIGIVLALIGERQYEARDLLGVYGFAQRAGLITFLGHAPGASGACLLEFALDGQGRFTGFQYAPDARTIDDKGKAGAKRYSPARFADAPYHVATPAHELGKELWVTEALHKANLVAEARSALAVGTFGAGLDRAADRATRALDPDKTRLIVVSLDRDKWAGHAETVIANKLSTAGWRVALARWDGAPDVTNGPDDAIRAGATFTLQPYTPPDGPHPKQDRRLRYVYPWQRGSETQDELGARLDASAERAARMAADHFDTGAPGDVLLIALAPGAGKSHAVAPLGARSTAYPQGERNLAWIGERHNMTEQVAYLPSYQHIRGCDAHNCPEHDLHDAVGRLGYNTQAIHKQHASGDCDYIRQFRQKGSAFYPLNFVGTPYPTMKGRDGIVIDEMNITNWLKEDTRHTFTISRLQEGGRVFMPDSHAGLFLRAIEAVIADAMVAQTDYHDASLFNALDARLSGQLAYIMGALAKDSDATNPRPWPQNLDINTNEALTTANDLAPVVLPTIYLPLQAEWVAHETAWRAGQQWNGRVRVGPVTASEYGIAICERLTFAETPPPVVVLDATADEALAARLLQGKQIKVMREDATPPAHMRHIAVRTGKRYGKLNMTAGTTTPAYQARVVAEIRYLLRDLDPDGALMAAGQVGIITHQGCETALGEALGIPAHRRGHFWAQRGNNSLEDCALLLIVGTPGLRPAHLATIARALYADDPLPLHFTYDAKGEGDRYTDPRVAHLVAYLADSELTQCAHRNRPLRYDGRTVVSLCAGAIDFLPITETISELPQLASEGITRKTKRTETIDARLTAAADALARRGAKVNLRTLAAEAEISVNEAARWLRDQRAKSPQHAVSTTSGMISTPLYKSYNGVEIMPEVTDTPADTLETPLADAEPLATRTPTSPAVLHLRIDEHIAFYTRQGLPEHEAIRRALIDRGGLPPARGERVATGAPMSAKGVIA